MSRKCVFQTFGRFPAYGYSVQAKVYRDSDTKEFVARFYVCGQLLSESDYFSNDQDDACNTAFLEIERHGRQALGM